MVFADFSAHFVWHDYIEIAILNRKFGPKKEATRNEDNKDRKMMD